MPMIINKNAENKKLKNGILAIASQASKAKRLDPNVINATSGTMKNEDGSLYEFSCVKEVIASMSAAEKFAYGDSSGSPTFHAAIYRSLFGEYLEEVSASMALGCVPTAGGTGGLNLAFSNYVSSGESVLLPCYMWENYLNFAKEFAFSSCLYSLFNAAGKFDIESVREKVETLKKTQSRIPLLINDPCENPTGFCMEDEDYRTLIALSKDDPDHQYVYIIDVAYFDYYDTNPSLIRKRYASFKNLPENAIALFVYSGSKSFGLYGLRIGALVALSHSQEEVDCLVDAGSFCSRVRWSSATTLGMNIIQKLVLNEKYQKPYQEEIRHVCALLQRRSEAFIGSAQAVKLPTLPYQRGFFLCVPHDSPEALMNALRQDGVYVIVANGCIRIALSSINLEEAKRLPVIIKKRIDLL